MVIYMFHYDAWRLYVCQCCRVCVCRLDCCQLVFLLRLFGNKLYSMFIDIYTIDYVTGPTTTEATAAAASSSSTLARIT